MITVQKTYTFDPEKDLIGAGGFGKVYKALDKNLAMTVAIKKYSGNLPSKYSLFEEIKRVIQLNHPNLVRYYDAFELEGSTTFNDKIQVGVMEYVNGGDLVDYLKSKPTEATLKTVFLGIMKGLQYLHSHHIIHRDLKPENILIQVNEDGTVVPKIADFGISKVLTENNSGSSLVIGSLEYMAPEQFNIVRYGIDRQLHTNLDLWSLGTIMYETFTGQSLFGKTRLGFSKQMIMKNILDKDLSDLNAMPQPFREITERCLVRKAAYRTQDVSELIDILEGKKIIENLDTNTVIMNSDGSLPKKANPTPSAPVTGDATVIHSGLQQSTDNQALTPPPIEQEIAAPASAHLPKKPILKEPKAFQLVYLLPFVTAAAGYAFYNSKKSIFGYETPLADYIIYPVIVCTVLALINVFSLFVKKSKGFEAQTYLFSFLLLAYYIGQGLIIQHFASPVFKSLGFKFDFLEHPFATYFPIAGIALVAVVLVARIRKIHWLEIVAALLSAGFVGLVLFPIFG